MHGFRLNVMCVKQIIPAPRNVGLRSGNGPSSPSATPSLRRGVSARRVTVAAKKRRAREPGEYEVRVVTPPPRSLGVYSLPQNTQNGDVIAVEDEGNVQDFVVTTVVAQYKLQGGRYQKEHNRLDVQPLSRWLVNGYLRDLMDRGSSQEGRDRGKDEFRP